MLDKKLIRSDLAAVETGLARRGFTVPVTDIESLESTRKDLQIKLEQLQSQRNKISKEFGLQKKNGADIAPIKAQMSEINQGIELTSVELEKISQCLDEIFYGLPNLLSNDVPEGRDESSNKAISQWGEPTAFDFPVKDHVELTEGCLGLNFELGAKLSGSRFVVMQGQVARLHRALAQFMLDIHVESHGYTEMNVPLLVNAENMVGTGQLPKFLHDQYKVEEKDVFLIPTGEVPLTNVARNHIFSEDELPMKFVAHTHCFRKEAGAAGKDTHGMIRQHQFEKVELVHITTPERSYDDLESLTGHAERILQLLGLPYRKMVLCAGDTGFTAAKTYDLEVWMPSQSTYREISSCSNCETFQARRMKARYRDGSGDIHHVHTLNGSGLAIGRTLIAILENYQTKEGNVIIPEPLRPYLGGMEQLTLVG